MNNTYTPNKNVKKSFEVKAYFKSTKAYNVNKNELWINVLFTILMLNGRDSQPTRVYLSKRLIFTDLYSLSDPEYEYLQCNIVSLGSDIASGKTKWITGDVDKFYYSLL